MAPTTQAMVDLVTRQIGWKVEGHYEALSDQVGQDWDRNSIRKDAPVSDLRRSIAIDPRMAVTIVHGWDDLSCPYYASAPADRADADLWYGRSHRTAHVSRRAHVLCATG